MKTYTFALNQHFLHFSSPKHTVKYQAENYKDALAQCVEDYPTETKTLLSIVQDCELCDD
jgi:hypothetical protein